MVRSAELEGGASGATLRHAGQSKTSMDGLGHNPAYPSLSQESSSAAGLVAECGVWRGGRRKKTDVGSLETT